MGDNSGWGDCPFNVAEQVVVGTKISHRFPTGRWHAGVVDRVIRNPSEKGEWQVRFMVRYEGSDGGSLIDKPMTQDLLPSEWGQDKQWVLVD